MLWFRSPEDRRIGIDFYYLSSTVCDTPNRRLAGDDLFRSLLPPSVVKAVSEYDEVKAELLRNEKAKVAEFDAALE